MRYTYPHVRVNPYQKLDFSDVLIVPRKSNISSRAQVDVKTGTTFKYSWNIWRGVPIISSNMDTVTNLDTFRVLKDRQMMTCFPKAFNKSWMSQKILPAELVDTDYYMLSTGIGDSDLQTLFHLLSRMADCNIFPKYLCIDVANGYMIDLLRTCAKIRKTYPEITLMAGNVVTPDGVKELIINGVDVVKVGIGSGLLCTTRKIAGVGFPQFSAVLECAEEAHALGGHIISDGGISVPGDVSKAFCAGSDFVMIGSMLAGHIESPGDVIEENGKKYKLAYGMSSRIANEKYAGGMKNYKAPEGKVVKMPLKGSLNDTLQRIEGGIRSTCTYIGAFNINTMARVSEFVQVNNQYNAALDKAVIDE